MSRLKAPKSYWPRRLLQVDGETFTSVERTGESSYGAFQQPKYNILSYTWGRFVSDTGQSVQINNIAWAVPRIRPDHFTPEDFSRAIRSAASNVSHIWLDIACIDQENNRIKLEEIGHQASIFERAEEAFVWLGQIHASQLDHLDEQLKQFNIFTPALLAKPDLVSLIKSTKQLLLQIFGDPWFSSLWTLQEAFLRPDARFIVKHGHGCPENDLALGLLLGSATRLVKEMSALLEQQQTLRRPGSLKAALARDLIGVVERSGSPELSSANGVLLYSASSKRTSWDPLDKVYGIMQVFGLVLGGAACPGRSFTLEELEYQLGAGLVEASPVYSQGFVHLEDLEVLGRRSWCIRNTIMVPSRASVTILPEAACTFRVDRETWCAHFDGMKCDFRSMTAFWKRGWEARARGPAWTSQAVEYIDLDRTARNKKVVPVDMLQGGSYQGGAGELNEILDAEYGPELSVLKLGKLRDGSRGQRNGHCWWGLLVFPVQGENIGASVWRGKTWKRTGICIWDVVDENLETDQEALFHICDLILS